MKWIKRVFGRKGRRAHSPRAEPLAVPVLPTPTKVRSTDLTRHRSMDEWQRARDSKRSLDPCADDGPIPTRMTDTLTITNARGSTLINNTYLVLESLGQGSFGKVSLAMNVQSFTLHAVKTCSKSRLSRASTPKRLRKTAVAGGSQSSLERCTSGVPLEVPSASSHATRRLASQPRDQLSAAQAASRPQPVSKMSEACALLLGTDTTHAAPRTPVLEGARHDATVMLCSTSAAESLSSLGSEPAAPSKTGPRSIGARTSEESAGTTDCAMLRSRGASLDWPGSDAQGIPSHRRSVDVPFTRRRSVDAYRSRRGPITQSTAWRRSMDHSGSLPTEAALSPGVFQEIAILKQLRHPNIVKLQEVVDDSSTGSLLLVMEYVQGGSLQQQQTGPRQWRGVPEALLRVWVRQVLMGLDYLHFNGVVHGDLKPQNLLTDGADRVKLADFGSATFYAESQQSCVSGTPAFRSPESLEVGYTAQPEADMWSLGVCMYVWRYGTLPFSGERAVDMYSSIRSAPVVQPPGGSSLFQDFLAGLLDRTPSTRTTAAAALRSEWLSGGGVPVTLPQRDAGVGRVGETLTQADIDGAISDACSAPVLTLMDQVFREEVFQHGAQLAAAGEPIEEVYLIVEGDVEVVSLSPTSPAMTDVAYSEASLCRDEAMQSMDSLFDFCPDMQEEERLRLRDALAAHGAPMQFDHSWSSSLLEPGKERSGRSLDMGAVPMQTRIVEHRGAGEGVGLSIIHREAGRSHNGTGVVKWPFSVHVHSPTARCMVGRVSDLRRLAEAHPEVASVVSQVVVQHQDDVKIAKAMCTLKMASTTTT